MNIGKIHLNQNNIKTPLHHALNYTVIISIIYIIYKFTSPSSPTGSAFISYIIPMVLTDVIIIAFPVLLVIFYLKDGGVEGATTWKNTMFQKDHAETKAMKDREILREYHGMYKEGIITEEEFNTIKKKFLNDIHKD